MRLLKGLALSFAVIAAVVYGMAIYSDPDGFWESLQGERDLPRGEPKSLEAFVLQAVTPASEEALAPVQSFVLVPPSEDAFDAGFLAYRRELQQAVAGRNLEKVLSLVSADVLISQDGEQGRAELSALLEAPDAGEANWQELQDILALPSVAISGARYCAPYVACAPLPEGADDLEPFETVFAVKPKVSVRAAPSEDAEVVTVLSYQSVQLAAVLDDPQWAEVIVENGDTGFVARSDIRQMLGAKAEFAKEGGVWRMKSFQMED
ncbi:MAG: SH3 domain-containing protein [Alphaproteobacteria bacterium]|nr:MAG: SH3 domain-containing protein [Alphaproteobacteria bacterium]